MKSGLRIAGQREGEAEDRKVNVLTDEGTLTVMFTDVESSTELVVSRGDRAARDLLREHEKIIRREAANYGGREIDAAGDGFLFVFPSARRAIASAAAIQQALGASQGESREVLVRIGLNSGDVINEEEKIYGSVVNAAARIAGKARGGEILVSDIVRQLAGSVPEASFREKGRFSLKGIPGRHRLFEAQWRQASSEPVPSAPAIAVLSGRTSEVQQIQALMDDAAAGSMRTIYLEGEAGIGKSRLTSEVVMIAVARGFKIFQGRAEELEQNRPFGPLLQAFQCFPGSGDPRREGIVDLLSPAASQGGGRAERFGITDAFAALLENESSSPTLVVLEDLHWADPETLVTIRVMQRHLAYQPVLMLVNFRPLPRPKELDALLRISDAQSAHFPLQPLDAEEVRVLVQNLLGAEIGEGLIEEVKGAGGNPLFIGELVHALSQEGAITIDEGRAEVEKVELPPTLRLTILRRIGTLPSEAVDLLRIASILGSSFTLSDLAAISGRSSVALLDPINVAMAAGVLNADVSKFTFRHDLLREAIYDDIPSAARAALHRDAAKSLAAAGASALKVAEHLVLGAEKGDRDAATQIATAAKQALVGSSIISASLYEKALSLVGLGDPMRDGIIVGYAESLSWADRPEEARSLVNEALTRPLTPELEAEFLILKADLAWPASEEQLAAVETLSKHPGLSRERRLKFRAFLLGSKYDEFPPGGYREAMEVVIKEAAAMGAQLIEAQAHAMLIWHELRTGSVEEALVRTERSIELAMAAQRINPHDSEALAHFAESLTDKRDVLQVLDRLDEAREVTRYIIRRSEDVGALDYAAARMASEANIEFRAGNVDHALVLINSSFDALAHMEFQALVYGYGILGLIEFRRGQAAAARDHIELFLRRAMGPDGQYLGREWLLHRAAAAFEASWTRGLLSEVAGDTTSALQHFDDAMHSFAYVEEPAANFVKLALRVGDRDRALAGFEKVRDRAQTGQTPRRRGLVLRLEGLIADDPDMLEAAVELYRQSPRPLETAWALEDAAEAAARKGDPKKARAMFKEALDAYEARGLAWDISRAASKMRRYGIPRGGRSPRGQHTVGWESLTPAELEVAKLIAEGLTNPEIAERLFISRQTVKSHLAHIFSKLNLSSRSELAALVVRHAG